MTTIVAAAPVIRPRAASTTRMGPRPRLSSLTFFRLEASATVPNRSTQLMRCCYRSLTHLLGSRARLEETGAGKVH